jgi:hypothetical protein
MRKAAISHDVYTQSPNHACIHRLAPKMHPQGCSTLSPPPYMSSAAAAAIIIIAKPELQQYLSVLLPLQEIANKTLSNQISSNFLYFSRRRRRRRREPHPSMSGGRKAHYLDIVATHTYLLDSSIPPSNLVLPEHDKTPTMQKALAVFKIQPETQRQPCKPCYYNNQPWNLQLKTRTKSRRHRMRERKTHKNTHKDGEILQSRKKRWPTTSRGQQHATKDLQHAFLVLLHQFKRAAAAAPIQTRCCCCFFFFFPCA